MGSKELFCPKNELEAKLKKQKESEVYALKSNFKPRDWRFPYIDYVLYGIFSEDPKEAIAIERKSFQFYYNAIDPKLFFS